MPTKTIDYRIIYGSYGSAWPCDRFGWCPDEDDPLPTQMLYPVSHGKHCPGHRQYIGWDNLRSKYPVSWRPRECGYWIQFSDEWKDAL
jgi:hypothetical protein